MQLFQINQSEDSSKINIMSDPTCGHLHQWYITSAFNYNRIYTLTTYYCDTDRALQQEDVLLRPREVSSESPEANE